MDKWQCFHPDREEKQRKTQEHLTCATWWRHLSVTQPSQCLHFPHALPQSPFPEALPGSPLGRVGCSRLLTLVRAQDLAEARGGCSAPSRTTRLRSVGSLGDAAGGARPHLDCGRPGPASQRTILPLAPGSGRFLLSSCSGLSWASTQEHVPCLQKPLS